MAFCASESSHCAFCLQIDASKIQEFHTRRQIPPQKLANPPPRPNPMVTQFVHYDRSPVYVDIYMIGCL